MAGLGPKQRGCRVCERKGFGVEVLYVVIHHIMSVVLLDWANTKHAVNFCFMEIVRNLKV